MVPLAVYLPEPMLDRVKRMAVKDRRSISTQALLLIEAGLSKSGG